MPTENELKFVLKLKTENLFKKISKNEDKILQGYLFSSKGIVLRVRKCIGENKSSQYLTLKSNVKKRVIEIEKAINKRDFKDLWSMCLNKLEKVRYYCDDSWGQNWEVDFFKDHNGCNYFCLAELEMPEGQKKPKFIPDFIKQNLLLAVPLTNCKYSSKLLANVRYASELYKGLSK